METYKPQPLEERKSQNLNFWDFTKEKLFWVALPFVTAGAAFLFGKVTKYKVWPLDGSPDIVSSLYAKGTKLLTQKHNIKGGEEVEKWINDGAWAGGIIEQFGGSNKGTWRKNYFNLVKGAEVAIPFSAYFLWNKEEGNRLDLEDAGNRLKKLQILKPSDAELAQHNEAMRRELAFVAQAENAPMSTIEKSGVEYQGRVSESQQQKAL